VNRNSAPDRRRILAAAAGWGAAAALPAHAWPWPRGDAPKHPQLIVAVFPLLDQIIKAALPGWQRRHPGVDVQIITRQYGDHHTAMTTALSTAVRLPDVMALESSFLGRFAPGRGLDDLAQSPYDIGRFRSRFVPFAYDQAINSRGQMVAAPTDIGPGTLLYRADLLAKAGLSADDLTPSWDAYIDAGIRLKATTGAYLISNAVLVKDIAQRSGMQPGEGVYFDKDSRVLVNSPRFVRAFELARRVRQLKLDARIRTWSNEWAEGFRRGTLATELGGAWMVGQMADHVAPATKGLWRAAQLPGQTFVSYGGTYYAIPRQSAPANKALAWDLIQWLTLQREQQFSAFKLQDAFPALLDTLDDPFFEQPLPFLGGQPGRLLWRDAARQIMATPPHKQNNFADEVMNAELGNVLDHGKNIQQALADAERLLVRRATR
jgi:multiple sugar transport system substrate-binding protein